MTEIPPIAPLNVCSHSEKREKKSFCQNVIYEISGLYCMGLIFYFEK